MISEQESRTIGNTSVVDSRQVKVIAVSSIATVFEWFDFFLYGSLAVIISRHFFSGVNEATAFVLALMTFAAGFAVRPLGALLFGFLGDRFGRKSTLLMALGLMGAATFAMGLIPSYGEIGIVAPWILVALRMVQGLSVGGVYGGAAVYVAEHAPQNRRGFFTSWIQITPSVGMALCLIVVFGTRMVVGEEDFSAWGWRVPFLLSSVLLAVTIWIQLQLSESPVYAQMKASGRASTRPFADAFGDRANRRRILVALFGAMIGQAVIWYTAQFYTLFFLERVLKVDGALTNLLVAGALFISTPLYLFFGWLSDKVGRRTVVLSACLLAALTYFPLFKALTHAANPQLARAVETAPVTVWADMQECSFQFDPVGKATFTSSCDIARSYLANAGISYETIAAPAGSVAELRVGDRGLTSFRGTQLSSDDFTRQRASWSSEAAVLLSEAGYPHRADPESVNIPMVLLILTVIMTFSAMVYGPIAALLTELFPAKVRYTSMSFPYHLAIGWFGGFLPTVAFAIVAATGNIYSGLWYPLLLSLLTFVVGVIFLPETRHANIQS